MNFTLHITDNCNFNCDYCPQNHIQNNMDFEVVKKAIEISMGKGKMTGFCFYGGEPLLNFGLIEKTIEYTKELSKSCNHSFNFKLNTNGSLLTESILQYLTENGVGIGFSHDGLMQNCCRKTTNGENTFDKVTENAKLLLKYQPKASVQTTVSPQAVKYFSESVDFLLSLGFRNILTTPAYGKMVKWTDKNLKELKVQYTEIAKLYEKWFAIGTDFYFAAFDTKIASHINGKQNPKHICHIGSGQYSISPNGKIYPCTQFVGNEDYCIGDVLGGIDLKKQMELSNIHIAPKSCERCAIKTRCVHTCGCANLTETGAVDRISPLQCEHERILIEISDILGSRLYHKYKENFIKKFYEE